MIKPTVGRIVHYYPKASEDLAGGPLAAIITRVWSDTCINIAVLSEVGHAHSRTSVLLEQDDQSVLASSHGFCRWMPYQTGQAAKTEKLQAQLDAKSS